MKQVPHFGPADIRAAPYKILNKILKKSIEKLDLIYIQTTYNPVNLVSKTVRYRPGQAQRVPGS